MQKKRKSRKLTEEQLKKRRESTFRRKIRNTFKNAGFEYINIIEKHIDIGLRTVEFDFIFFFENILLVCEDTCIDTSKRKNLKTHIRNKMEAFETVRDNTATYLNWLFETFPEKTFSLKQYRADRIQIFFLYFSQNELALSDAKLEMYSLIKFVEPQTLDYFDSMSKCIRLSCRYEIFRFLGIKNDKLGIRSSDSNQITINATIISPKDFTGLRNDVRIVSFMMSAKQLLRTCYVLRKDNWEESIDLYQRLVRKKKIHDIRQYIADKGVAFYNNIIVGLPDTTSILDNNGKHLDITSIGDIETCKLVIPGEMNSICVIDGQHRIFAHYEGPLNDKYEKIIAPLRKQLHLLVTGLIFPPTMRTFDRVKLQSEIFLDINSNAKPVPADLLLHIMKFKAPSSDLGLARLVIEKLNKHKLFLNKFQISSLDKKKIKVASIVKFALRYLVTIAPAEKKSSISKYWNGNLESVISEEEEAIDNYVSFCADKLDVYFSAIKDRFSDDWHDPESKLLSVISINGFIMAYTRHLRIYGADNNFQFYKDRLKKLEIDFSKKGFPYTSSQYRIFSTRIIEDIFDLDETEL